MKLNLEFKLVSFLGNKWEEVRCTENECAKTKTLRLFVQFKVRVRETILGI